MVGPAGVPAINKTLGKDNLITWFPAPPVDPNMVPLADSERVAAVFNNCIHPPMLLARTKALPIRIFPSPRVQKAAQPAGIHRLGLICSLAWWVRQRSDWPAPKKKESRQQSMLVRRGSGCTGLLGGSIYATKVCYHNPRASIDLDMVLDLEYQPPWSCWIPVNDEEMPLAIFLAVIQIAGLTILSPGGNRATHRQGPARTFARQPGEIPALGHSAVETARSIAAEF